MTYSSCSSYTIFTFVASNPRCAKLVSQLQTNSYNFDDNFDEAVALKEGLILYTLPEIQ